MTDHPPPPGEQPSVPEPTAAAALASATRALQARSRRRALEIAPLVLRDVLARPGRSLPVRHRDHDWLWLGDRVLVGRLRSAVDDGVEGAAVQRVDLDVDRHGRLQRLQVVLLAQYGHSLVRVADRVRAVTEDVLYDLLGAGDTDVRVITDLHVGDVTRGDPTRTDPADEGPTSSG